MKDLLLAIQSALRSGLNSTLYRIGTNPEQSDIFIADAEQYLPSVCLFPAVGIKDGPEGLLQKQACGAGQIEEIYTQTVNIIPWAPALSAVIGAGLVGDTTQPGVHGIKDDIHNILANNFFWGLGVEAVERGSIPPSQPVEQADGRIGQNIIIPYIYTRRRIVLRP